MKAIVYERYGTANVLHVREIDRPKPKAGEILIEIRAAEATKADCELRSFTFPVKWTWIPLRLVMGITRPRNQVLGCYFAGVVSNTGKNVSNFHEGDEVFGCARLRMGAYGEYACYPANYTIVPKPLNMTFEEAAAVPLGGLNALHFLGKAHVQGGEAVLINGAGGSIGTFAVQIAKAMGAEVTAVDSGTKKEMLRGLGADHFVDYTKEDFTERHHEFDVILDMVAQSSYSACIGALTRNGRYLMANPRILDMLRSVATSRFTNRNAIFAFAGETEDELFTLKRMIEENKLRSTLDKIYPINQASEAHRRVETEQRLGSVVISMR